MWCHLKWSKIITFSTETSVAVRKLWARGANNGNSNTQNHFFPSRVVFHTRTPFLTSKMIFQLEKKSHMAETMNTKRKCKEFMLPACLRELFLTILSLLTYFSKMFFVL